MIHLRTPEEKADPDAWWRQPDEIFFSSGACHILASAFLRAVPDKGFTAIFINPKEGFRGGHVVAAKDSLVFDAQGFQCRLDFLDAYFSEMRGRFDGWDANIRSLRVDPAGWEFCRMYRYRHPSQFSGDVVLRAERFAEKLTAESPAEKDVRKCSRLPR